MSSNLNEDAHPGLSRRRVLALTALVEGGMLVAAVALGWAGGVRFWDGVEVSGRAAAYAVALTVPLLIALAVAARTSWSVVERIRQDLDLVLPMFRNCTVFDLLLMSLLAGAGEEALFRGFLQPVAVDTVGALPGLVVVSVMFGLVHLVSIPYAVFATGMGLYLGAIQFYTGNLFVPAAVHALYDFVALVYLLRVRANASNGA